MFVLYCCGVHRYIFMLCSLVHATSRILDYSGNTTSQRGSLCV